MIASIFSLSLTYGQITATRNTISINYNDIYIGKNISVEYGRFIDSLQNNSFNLGVKYHDNSPIQDNQYHLFKDRFFAESFLEHIGLTIGYNRFMHINSIKVTPFIFGQSDISYISMHNIARSSLEPFPDDTPIYEEHSFSTPPWLTIETRIGLGVIIPVNKRIYIKETFGAGVAYFHEIEKDPNVVILVPKYWEVFYPWNIGIVYSFKSKSD